MKQILFTTGLLSIMCYTAQSQTNLQWQQNLGGTKGDSAYSVKPTSDGGYIVAGQSRSNDVNVTGNHGGIDYWVAKLNASGAITWQKSFGGSGTDIAKCVLQTTDGGYIVAGISNSIDGDVYGHGRNYSSSVGSPGPIYTSDTIVYEPWVVKLDNSGGITWQQCYNSLTIVGHNYLYFDTRLNSIIQTSDGGYMLAGSGPLPVLSTENVPSENGSLLIKTSSNGGETWRKSLEGNMLYQDCKLTDVVQVGTGYTVVGYGNLLHDSPDNFGLDFFIRNVSSTGDYVWGTELGSSGDDIPGKILKTLDGGYVVTGVAGGGDLNFAGTGYHGAKDFFAVKLASSGAVSWTKCFGGSKDDEAKAIQQKSDGTYLVAGLSYSTDGQVTDHKPGRGINPLHADYWVIKLAATGTFIWGKSFGGYGNDKAASLEKTSDGGFIVAGTSGSTDAGFTNKGVTDYWLLKLQECGVIPLPSAAANQTFCSTNNPTVANLAATGSGIKWYTAATGGAALDPSAALQNGNYYASQTTGTCESARTMVSVSITVTTRANVVLAQSFCSSANPTVANLTAIGTSIKWYTTSTGGTALPPGTALVNGAVYYVSQTLSGCESSRRGVTVTILAPVPAAVDQTFCSTDNPVVANLVATGSNLKWYTTASGGTALASSAALITGSYYVSQTEGSCESTRKIISVTVKVTTRANVVLAQSFCSSVHPTIASLQAIGTSIKWYTTLTGGSALPVTTPLANNAVYYVSQTLSGCESSRRGVTVTLTACRLSKMVKETDYKGEGMLYPNPADDIVNIKIKTTDKSNRGIVMLLDVYGRVLLKQQVTNNNGIIRTTVDIRRFPAGQYAVKYFIGEDVGVLKLQVIK